MAASTEAEGTATRLLESEGLRLLSCTPIQSLWAGYGQICRVKVSEMNTGSLEVGNSSTRPISLILKYVQPPAKVKSKRSQGPDEGHIRKVVSYQIEQYFYTHLVPQMPASIGMADCIASINTSDLNTCVTAMIMSDLRNEFPLAGEEGSELTEKQTDAALGWLADFHGFWWTKIATLRANHPVLPPLEHYAQSQNTILDGQGVWLNGGYTYLATRQTEYAALLADSHSEWSSLLGSAIEPGKATVAELVAAFLAPARDPATSSITPQLRAAESSQPYQTLLHGDVKSENLFTTVDGHSVAFYDFQHVGLGLGVCDLAKFFACCVPLHMLLEDVDSVYQIDNLPMQEGERILLQTYLSRMRRWSGKEYEWNLFVRHWETALVDWLRFQASWGFWGNSEWLEARTRSILADRCWVGWLEEVSKG